MIAAAFAPRPHPFLFGIGLATVGLLLAAFLVRETRDHLIQESVDSQGRPQLPSFWDSIKVSLQDLSLLSCNQGGLVTKINDATVWGLVPLFLAAQGLGVARISVVAAIYPTVWGVSQFFTDTLSDHLGRKPLIVTGMLVQGLGIWLLAAGGSFALWMVAGVVLGLGTALVYPTLIAAVGDYAHPMRRASSIGIYRWYRDAGFVVEALLAGTLADTIGYRPTFALIGVINVVSAFLVWTLMRRPEAVWRSAPSASKFT